MSANPGPINTTHQLGKDKTFSFAIGTKFKGRRAFQVPAYRLFHAHGCLLGSPRLRTGKELSGDKKTDERICPCYIKLKFQVYALETPVDEITFEIAEFVNRHANHPKKSHLPKLKTPFFIQKTIKVRVDGDITTPGSVASGNSDYEEAEEEDELDSVSGQEETMRNSALESSRSPLTQAMESDDSVESQSVQHLASDFRGLSASPRRRHSSATQRRSAPLVPATAATSSRARLSDGANPGPSQSARAEQDIFGTKRQNPSTSSSGWGGPPAKQPKPNVTAMANFDGRQTASAAASDQLARDRVRTNVGSHFLHTQSQPVQSTAQLSSSFGDFLRGLVERQGRDYKFIVVDDDSQEEIHTLDYLVPYFEATPYRTSKRIEIQLPSDIQTEVTQWFAKLTSLSGRASLKMLSGGGLVSS